MLRRRQKNWVSKEEICHLVSFLWGNDCNGPQASMSHHCFLFFFFFFLFVFFFFSSCGVTSNFLPKEMKLKRKTYKEDSAWHKEMRSIIISNCIICQSERRALSHYHLYDSNLVLVFLETWACIPRWQRRCSFVEGTCSYFRKCWQIEFFPALQPGKQINTRFFLPSVWK